jgi:predicted ArsR family transcriptional regulator
MNSLDSAMPVILTTFVRLVNKLIDLIDKSGVGPYGSHVSKEPSVNSTRAEERFFGSTRGRVVTLLRRERRTVDELAGELELTDNAIRAHLVALERDGLVTQGELRRGSGKPSFTYELTPEAERLFPKAYGVLLQQLLDILDERLPRDVMADALREVGHRLAAGHPSGDDGLPQRIDMALALLGNLGGLAEADVSERGVLIKGYSCPLAAAVEGNPDACLVAETLLSDLIGVPVHQVCDQGPPPRCRFEIPTAVD